jgi:protein-tyrosine phosphatase
MFNHRKPFLFPSRVDSSTLLTFKNYSMKPFYILLFSFCLALATRAQVLDSLQRKVRVSGAVNFRDLGGYRSTDGRQLKWGRIYRSADISRLTPDDLDTLRARSILTVVDLRGTEESSRAPDRLCPGTDYLLCPAGSDQNLSGWLKSISGMQSGGDSIMESYYANTEFLAARYKPLFEKLLKLSDDRALLFHCTAGKDRTGIGAALLLYALGIPEETILNDYLASDYYRAAENEKAVHSMVAAMKINENIARDMLAVKASYLQATFEAIRKKSGSVDRYLSEELGLDQPSLQSLRNKFLQ